MVYIGKTNRALKERRKEHEESARQGNSDKFHKELLAQKISNWNWKPLKTCDEKDALSVEKEWIKKFQVEGLELLNTTHNRKKPINTKKASRFKQRASGRKTWESADAMEWMYEDGKILPVKNLNTGEAFRSLTQAEKKDKIGRASIKRSCETGHLAMNECKYAYIDLEGNEQLTDGHEKKIVTRFRRSYSAIKHLGTGKIFRTIEEAAVAFDLNEKNIQAVCGNQYKSTNGHLFCYVNHDGEDVLYSKHKLVLAEMAEKERFCLAAYELVDTKYEYPQLFSTTTEVAKELGIRNNGHIAAVVRGDRSHVEGYRIARYDKQAKQPELTDKHKLPPKKVMRKIICLDDSKIFESLNDAARKCGVNAGQIGLCCRGVLKTTGRGKKKLRFAYIDEHGNPMLTSTHRKAEESLAWKGIEVYCPEFDMKFRSIAEFRREAKVRGVNISSKRIRRHLKDPTVSLRELHVFECSE